MVEVAILYFFPPKSSVFSTSFFFLIDKYLLHSVVFTCTFNTVAVVCRGYFSNKNRVLSFHAEFVELTAVGVVTGTEFVALTAVGAVTGKVRSQSPSFS